MNIPNKITLLRIFMVPVFMIFALPFPDILLEISFFKPILSQLNAVRSFLAQYGNYIAAIIFILAACTDSLDGYLARKNNQITALGQFLDPIADKLLVTGALIALVERSEITSWIVLIVVGRDLIVNGLRFIAAVEGKVIAASKWGKIKTLAQMIAIVAVMLDNFPLNYITDFDFGSYAMLAAVIATIFSGIHYIYINKHIFLINGKKPEDHSKSAK
ncbi:MAG: CDP-diacylglycerol--glycerol-3-phosphate 3-phosphatidyltransferase [Eubacteriales bacterium]|nr:CDP-diacylglycerol--glycerol-3-phosphate 3-phosphatidyltransferase [Eubacteriales bacterium]